MKNAVDVKNFPMCIADMIKFSFLTDTTVTVPRQTEISFFG